VDEVAAGTRSTLVVKSATRVLALVEFLNFILSPLIFTLVSGSQGVVIVANA
jgi:hypothetical protein